MDTSGASDNWLVAGRAGCAGRTPEETPPQAPGEAPQQSSGPTGAEPVPAGAAGPPGFAIQARTTRRSGTSRANSAADRAERAADARAEVLDDGDASHDDQGQHHRILDGRRAVLALEKPKDLRCRVEHGKPLGSRLVSR